MTKKELENLVKGLASALRASPEECYHLQEQYVCRANLNKLGLFISYHLLLLLLWLIIVTLSARQDYIF